MDKQQLLNDEQIRHFIVNGYVNVTADIRWSPVGAVSNRASSSGERDN